MIVEYIRKGQCGIRNTIDLPKEVCELYAEVLKGHFNEDLIKVHIKEK